jgi:hypothetical protein
MYLLGHIGSALICYIMISYIFENDNWDHKRNQILISIGAILPDLLDKPIGALIFGIGRWIGHSILFQLTFYIIVKIVVQKYKPSFYKKYDIEILLTGAIIHLIGDLPGLPLETIFWPMLGGFEISGNSSFLLGYQNIETIITEIGGVLVITILGITQKWRINSWKIVFVLIAFYELLFLMLYTFFIGI